MISLVNKKKKNTKKPKVDNLQKLYEEFEQLEPGLVQNIFENLDRDYKQSK